MKLRRKLVFKKNFTILSIPPLTIISKRNAVRPHPFPIETTMNPASKWLRVKACSAKALSFFSNLIIILVCQLLYSFLTIPAFNTLPQNKLSLSHPGKHLTMMTAAWLLKMASCPSRSMPGPHCRWRLCNIMGARILAVILAPPQAEVLPTKSGRNL